VREDRQYRKGLSREEAITLILKGSGTQYDPKVVSMFIAHLPEFEAEIEARRNQPPPTFGIEPIERLSEAARRVLPASGLAEDMREKLPPQSSLQEQTRAISELAKAILSARCLDEMLASFADRLKALVDYDTCAITLVTPESGVSRVEHAAGLHGAALRGRCIVLGEGVTGWVITNKRPFCNTDPKLDLPPQLADAFSSYRTLAVFPVMKGGAIYGAITLYSASLLCYTIHHHRLLEEATNLLAAALSVDEEFSSVSGERPVLRRRRIKPDIESEMAS
jgi:transcriptional regulator with GAF, ATPase, and Fis domain